MINIIILIILVLVNAFFAGSEIALISLNKNKIRSMRDEGDKKANIVYKLIEIPTRLLSMIQIGVTLSGFLNSALASDVFADNLVELMLNLGLTINVGSLRSIAMIIITLLLTIVTLIFGELVPKRIAMNNPEKFSFAVAYPLYLLYRFVLPLVHILSFMTNIVLRLVGIDPNKNENQVTEEEIRLMVATSSEEGEIANTEKEMIDNIFEFNDTTVEDVMTHRVDVEALDIDCSYDEVMKYFKSAQYTRIPIYENTLDNVVGILNAKDVLRFISKMKDVKDFSLKKIMRKPVFVPDSKPIDKLFYELKVKKTHIAIVIDEYGGTAGIVTMEDLIEEIVGEVFDEYDIVPVEYQKISDDKYIMDGSIELDEVEKLLGIEMPVDEYDTLNGFMIAQLGRLPNENDHDKILYGDYQFEILKVDEKVIEKVKVEKFEKESEEG
ncbi:putative hemolysin [Breznakia sp. PF5-3]|uniref:hemolysin family protein n=1 Tax=unclassified Breznakia TaxID=2623764 RepID=UPI002405AA4A|nr:MULTISPECIES: hemolysin family protein [unclassified Breznakia]MDF9824261.1 putative hemolysin [Breznakia sp. PM6-1]MDF9835172.1 putative hemolysin [Breznakia sp. PF5-3]MDF9837284.1 putative hemolysin [Breznakia sp. PFB2-8]MDF9859419.1 putative hemolysin [Breznakia sp. PH5-24]